MQYKRHLHFPGSQRMAAHCRARMVGCGRCSGCYLRLCAGGFAVQSLRKVVHHAARDIQAQLKPTARFTRLSSVRLIFDGSFSAVWWTLNLLPTNAEFAVNGVRRMSVDGSNDTEGSMSAMPEVPFELKWREEGGPGKDSYSVDSPKNTVYVFFGSQPKRVVVELRLHHHQHGAGLR